MFKSFLLAIILMTAATSSVSAVTCADGENQMSVEGVEGVFCVVGTPCIATVSTGACPNAQEGLPYGSYCGVVASGVYGCKVHNTAPTPTPESTTEVPTTSAPVPLTPFTDCSTEATHVSVQGVQGSFCVNEPVCFHRQLSCPAERTAVRLVCDLLKTGAYGCRRYTADNVPTNVTYAAPLDCTGNPAGDIPVSIVSGGDFCAPEPVCSGTIFGNCPQIQDGLLQDSECMIVETGVYGCVFMAST
ncbi:hypothetical protein PHMEG_0003987 [Phytophthora megakarya]|uniref:Cysteine-rich protein n=1 Tax=Phytophthora megakarya TaxID=4795 RepID=A0A225WV31_9STRA|nr:hypothetical protein PHMEG_0003987 [Phytophthora megakarya]